jgi:NAD(P)-dependent dehydrogenase (short-subunit alcohol dehydrogenase family)
MTAQHSGAIVTIASQLARAGGRANASYITSKGAVVALTRAVALDYVDQGIRCNTVLPGATDTPLLQRSFARQPDPDAARERSRTRHAMGRFGKPEEIAAAILYLASDESSFVTGVELPVDGGWLAA